MPDAVRDAEVAALRKTRSAWALPDFDYWLFDETVPRCPDDTPEDMGIGPALRRPRRLARG
jgi:hypothetical protein